MADPADEPSNDTVIDPADEPSKVTVTDPADEPSNVTVTDPADEPSNVTVTDPADEQRHRDKGMYWLHARAYGRLRCQAISKLVRSLSRNLICLIIKLSLFIKVLCIRNISVNTTEDEMKKVFGEYEPIFP